MSRSTKKGPFVSERLIEKVKKTEKSGKKAPIKTYSRASVIIPEFIRHTFLVHNGKRFIPVYVTEAMVGYRLGEFSPTRFFKGHGTGHKESVSLK